MVRVAIIGAGGIGHFHAEALNRIDRVQISGFYDVNEKKAKEAVQKFGGEPYTKLSECIKAADAIWIMTPPSTHLAIASEAILAGKHVFCEKPIAITIDDACQMKQLAEMNSVLFMVGFNMRYRYSYKRVKEIIETGKIGKVINFWSQRMGLGAGSKGGWGQYNWRTDPNLMCGMCIESLSHDIDMMRWLVGDIKDVRSAVFESIQEIPQFDDNAAVAMTLKNGGLANIFASWSSYITQNSRGVIGTKGTVIIEGKSIWDVDRLRLLTNDMTYEMVEIIDNDTLDVSSYYAEDLHFIECIEKGITPDVTVEDGVKALEISHAILKSGREKCIVTLS